MAKEYLLLSGATAANAQNAAAPSASTTLLDAEAPIPTGTTSFARKLKPHITAGAMTDRGTLFVKSTAGSAVMSMTDARIWVGVVHSGATTPTWYPLGIGTDPNKGKINSGSAIGETGNDDVKHCEMIYGFADAEYIYFQAGTIGGTATAFDAILRCRL